MILTKRHRTKERERIATLLLWRLGNSQCHQTPQMRAAVGGSSKATGPPELSVKPEPDTTAGTPHLDVRRVSATSPSSLCELWREKDELVGSSSELIDARRRAGRQEQQRRFRARPAMVKCASPLTTGLDPPRKDPRYTSATSSDVQKRRIRADDEIARSTKASEPIWTFCILRHFFVEASSVPGLRELEKFTEYPTGWS